MRILTYKRTHTGDPDASGRFGVNDCMGRIRSLQYDAVIGVGGKGTESRKFGIDGKITWVGLGPRRRNGGAGRRAEIVTFEHFILFDDRGPPLHEVAPTLARKMYSGRRFVLDSYTEEEKSEAVTIIQWAVNLSADSISQRWHGQLRISRKIQCSTTYIKKTRCRFITHIKRYAS